MPRWSRFHAATLKVFCSTQPTFRGGFARRKVRDSRQFHTSAADNPHGSPGIAVFGCAGKLANGFGLDSTHSRVLFVGVGSMHGVVPCVGGTFVLESDTNDDNGGSMHEQTPKPKHHSGPVPPAIPSAENRNKSDKTFLRDFATNILSDPKQKNALPANPDSFGSAPNARYIAAWPNVGTQFAPPVGATSLLLILGTEAESPFSRISVKRMTWFLCMSENKPTHRGQPPALPNTRMFCNDL